MTLGRSPSGAIKIKTDGGLRAVSCGCCGGEPPSGCCLYPAQELIDRLYTVDDLPEIILYQPAFSQEYPSLEFIELQKVETPYQSDDNLILVYYTGSFIAKGSIIPDETVPIEVGILEAGLSPNQQICWGTQTFVETWNVQIANPCLIDGLKIKNKFADSYTVISTFGVLPGPTIITRTGNCDWSKVWNDPSEYGYCPTSEYNFLPDGNVNLISEGPPYGSITLGNYAGKWSILLDRGFCGGYSDFGIKFPNSSSPVGEYRFFEDLTFIIS